MEVVGEEEAYISTTGAEYTQKGRWKTKERTK